MTKTNYGHRIPREKLLDFIKKKQDNWSAWALESQIDTKKDGTLLKHFVFDKLFEMTGLEGLDTQTSFEYYIKFDPEFPEVCRAHGIEI